MSRAFPGALLGAVVIASAATPPVGAQAARAVLEADRTEVTVGDRLTAVITIQHGADQTVRWGDSVDLAPFEILGFAPGPPRVDGDRAVSTATLTLAVFELGELEIPPIRVTLRDASGGETVVETDPFGVGVVSVGLDEGGDIRDLKGPRYIARVWVLLWPWLLAALALATLVGWLILRRRAREPSKVGRASPPRMPHEVARRALDRLEASTLLARGQVKEFHIEVSQIIRTYAEARFGIDALELTTRELIDALRSQDVGDGAIEEVRRFLESCDMVKFARRRPDEGASMALIPVARAFIEATARVEREPSAEPEPSAAPEASVEAA